MKQTVCFAKCERYDPRAVEQGVERILAQYGGAGSVVLFENDLPDNYNE